MFVRSVSHCLGSSCRRFLPYVSVGMNCFQNISYFQYRMTSTHVNINRIYRSTAFPAFSSKGIKTASRCNVDEFSTSDICKLINSIDISSDDKTFLSLTLPSRKDLSPSILETAIRGLMHSRLYNDIIHLFRMTMANYPGFAFSISSIELVFQSVLISKNYTIADQVWSACDDRTKKCCSVWSIYCRILLSDRRLHDARPYLDQNQKQAYSNPTTNCEILQGLYTGKYYDECLKFYSGLFKLDPSGQSLGEATSYHAACKAAYQLHDYRRALEVFEVMKKKKMRLSRPVAYMIAEIYQRGDFWRVEYEQKIDILRENGIIPTERQQLQLLAQSRLFQFSEGSRILQEYSKLRNESSLVRKENGDFFVNVEQYYEPHRCLRLFGVMNDIGDMRNVKKSNVLTVKTVQKDKELSKLLKSEVYPSIRYTIDKDLITIPISSIQYWKNHRNDPVL